ncbi:WecB/TagA/CpsF family glycosyltransferase [Lentilactobacillus kefiri]|uniref:WecB/TagA/CpsF family glycosyltransferase n=1 Tax=Lentilactobacillus kefiri TaxID=33962 RepID=UPI000D64FCF6|nr:WecB/TagA/CpsF family glycosyltransferase [Lentilactobacillus kefiri]
MNNQSTANTVDILGIHFLNTTEKAFQNILHKRINDGTNTFVVTANPEIVMYAKSDPSYEKLIQTADYIIPDGIGIIIGAKMLKTPLHERVTGYDLFVHLLEWGNAHQKSAYFVGAQPAVIRKLRKVVEKDYPFLTIASTHDGYFGDDRNIVHDINRTKPDMVFVATGYPKQEEFIDKNRSASDGLWIGIGGSFDVLTGTVKRAPKAWQRMHLEWLYRVVKEPSRIGRLMVLPKYLWQIIKQKFSKKN